MTHTKHPAAPFPETADIETSSDDYATRFRGAVGGWLLDTQERLTVALMTEVPHATILDVGGGHGQLANPFCARGLQVTVLGSAESCRTRIAPALATGRCTFTVGNVISLPFADKSFDTVLSFRMLTHCTEWRALTRELCRVARHAVIVDYPTSQSLNCIAPSLFKAKKKVEVNTRPWRLFAHAEVEAAFAEAGYVLDRKSAQFFLPMVLHRMLKSRGLSIALERICRSIGLTGRWGSPVIARWAPASTPPRKGVTEI